MADSLNDEELERLRRWSADHSPRPWPLYGDTLIRILATIDSARAERDEALRRAEELEADLKSATASYRKDEEALKWADKTFAAQESELESLRAERDRQREELEAAYEVLVFADGLAVSRTGMPLSRIYAEDAPAQLVLKAAGCWPRETPDDTD